VEKQILNALQDINKKLVEHDEKFDEQRLLLTSLRSAQEETTAKVDALAAKSATEFDEIKEKINNLNISFDLLKDESWQNKHDIHRIKTTLGYK
jgi:arginyl-tRNA synthetase